MKLPTLLLLLGVAGNVTSGHGFSCRLQVLRCIGLKFSWFVLTTWRPSKTLVCAKGQEMVNCIVESGCQDRIFSNFKEVNDTVHNRLRSRFSYSCDLQKYPCARDCKELPDGYYPLCEDCEWYAYCLGRTVWFEDSCWGDWSWDSALRRCSRNSQTCAMNRTRIATTTPSATTTTVSTATTRPTIPSTMTRETTTMTATPTTTATPATTTNVIPRTTTTATSTTTTPTATTTTTTTTTTSAPTTTTTTTPTTTTATSKTTPTTRQTTTTTTSSMTTPAPTTTTPGPTTTTPAPTTTTPAPTTTSLTPTTTTTTSSMTTPAPTTTTPAPTTTTQRPTTPSTKHNNPGICVNDCSDLPNGDYQSCLGCTVFATCSNNILQDNRPCAATLVWDDILKTCTGQSTTCSED